MSQVGAPSSVLAPLRGSPVFEFLRKNHEGGHIKQSKPCKSLHVLRPPINSIACMPHKGRRKKKHRPAQGDNASALVPAYVLVMAREQNSRQNVDKAPLGSVDGQGLEWSVTCAFCQVLRGACFSSSNSRVAKVLCIHDTHCHCYVDEQQLPLLCKPGSVTHSSGSWLVCAFSS